MFNFFEKTEKKVVSERKEPKLDLEPLAPKKPKETGLEIYLGKPVICVSNEFENISVGIGQEVAYLKEDNKPVLIVYDLIRKEEIIPFGMIFAYTEQKFDALNNLTPDQRSAILFEKDSTKDVALKPYPNQKIFNPLEWKRMVTMELYNWHTSKNAPHFKVA